MTERHQADRPHAMTEELFREDATLHSCPATVLAVDEVADPAVLVGTPPAVWVVLDCTVFYPLGGGHRISVGRGRRRQRRKVEVGQAHSSCVSGRLPLGGVSVPEDDVDEVSVGLIEDGVLLGHG